MEECKYPNNLQDSNINYCKNKKFNICYGEGERFSNLKELEEHVKKLEYDANLSEELGNVFTNGCWENKSNKPFIKDFNKLDEKDPNKCLTNGNKWITGDGYILSMKDNVSKLESDTVNKINVVCSPGYEGQPNIEAGNCNDYTSFKEGDKGKYEQFTLSGCNLCKPVYGGNRLDNNDKTCYPECGLSGTEYFDSSNSNKRLRFIDTKDVFESGKKRAGYCCNNVDDAILMRRIKDSEIVEGSNHLICNVLDCEIGYMVVDETTCCRKIENSKDDVEYDCGGNKENTKPIDPEINYCKDGYHPAVNNENGFNICKPCEKEENGIHLNANVTCDMNGENVKLQGNSEFKCIENGDYYYNELNEKCEKCLNNMEINLNYDKNDLSSNICKCKSEYEIDGQCYNCPGENIEVNEIYPLKGSMCKCNVTEYPLENVEYVGCEEGSTLYEGDTCSVKCKDGYKTVGGNAMITCLKDKIDYGDIRCVPDNIYGENKIIEGFTNMFTNNTKRLLLLFLLVILILKLFEK